MENIRRQKKKKNTMINLLKRYKQQEKEDNEDYEHNIPYIYEHILLQIFAKIPQEDLQELRYTCKFWNKTISNNKFMAQNFLQSKSSLLIQFRKKFAVTFKSKLLELDHEGLGFKLDHFANMTRMGQFRSTCNGLILINSILRINRSRAIYRFLVVNMVTKCQITIPNCPSGCRHQFCSLSLVFTPHDQKHYKVVHISSNRFGFEILTLGCAGNQWKVIPGPFQDEAYDRSWDNPVSIGQFLHWDVESDFYILSMDVYNETTWKTYLPHYYVSFRIDRMSLIEMGGHLCFMYSYTTTQFDVWVLKDARGQNWQRSFSIFAESINYLLPRGASPIGEWENALPDFQNLVTLCSLRNGEVIVFRNLNSRWLYLYDTKIKELRKLSELSSYKDYDVLPYKSSLIYWQNAEELLSRETI
ncbi:F-box protein At5g49610 [Morus notabilis]|nr:F-box protein At5g49610 [Morus notabilis]